MGLTNTRSHAGRTLHLWSGSSPSSSSWLLRLMIIIIVIISCQWHYHATIFTQRRDVKRNKKADDICKKIIKNMKILWKSMLNTFLTLWLQFTMFETHQKSLNIVVTELAVFTIILVISFVCNGNNTFWPFLFFLNETFKKGFSNTVH